MFDILNEWKELDRIKNETANFQYDKYWDHECEKFEFRILLSSDDEDEIFKCTLIFHFDKYIEKGKCYTYVDTFDARCVNELIVINDILSKIEKKCNEFTLWLSNNNYDWEEGRCYLKNQN